MSKDMEEKKELILGIAKSQFERFGFKKTTIEDICTEARIAKKSFYSLFKDKEDLFVSLFIKEIRAARRRGQMAADKVDHALEKLKRTALTSFEYQRKEPFFASVLNDDTGMYAPYLQHKFRDFLQEEIIEAISDIIEEGMRRGEIRKCDPRLTSYYLFKVFQSMTYARSIPRPRSIKTERAEVTEVLDLVFTGISKQT